MEISYSNSIYLLTILLITGCSSDLKNPAEEEFTSNKVLESNRHKNNDLNRSLMIIETLVGKKINYVYDVELINRKSIYIQFGSEKKNNTHATESMLSEALELGCYAKSNVQRKFKSSEYIGSLSFEFNYQKECCHYAQLLVYDFDTHIGFLANLIDDSHHRRVDDDVYENFVFLTKERFYQLVEIIVSQ